MNSSLPVLPISVQSLSQLREDDAIYVDKTRMAYKLMKYDARPVFFTRPRRFGKSLMLSVLEEAYKGNKELFAGTWLGDHSGYDFPAHHVLHFNFATMSHDPRLFAHELSSELLRQRRQAQLPAIEGAPGFLLKETIRDLATDNKKIVILIDEYEAPLITHLHNREALEANQETMKNFFIQTKSEQSPLLKKVVMTGLTRLGLDKTESGANHFIDISFDEDFTTMCGYTRAEIEEYFPEYLHYATQRQQIALDELWTQLSYWYNGYSWNLDDPSDPKTRVYCPLSIVKFFKNPTHFRPHWYETSTGFLASEGMKTAEITYNDLDTRFRGETVSTLTLETDDPKSYDGVGLLFQTGYLTLYGSNAASDSFVLGLPNEEVRRSLALSLLSKEITVSKSHMIAERIKNSIEHARWDKLIEAFDLLLASVASVNHARSTDLHTEQERSYNGKLFMAIRSAVNATNEDPGSGGYADTVITHLVNNVPTAIIIEYKLSTSDKTRQAHKQIASRNYAAKYSNLPVYAIAITIDPQEKTISKYDVKQLHPGWVRE